MASVIRRANPFNKKNRQNFAAGVRVLGNVATGQTNASRATQIAAAVAVAGLSPVSPTAAGIVQSRAANVITNPDSNNAQRFVGAIAGGAPIAAQIGLSGAALGGLARTVTAARAVRLPAIAARASRPPAATQAAARLTPIERAAARLRSPSASRTTSSSNVFGRSTFAPARTPTASTPGLASRIWTGTKAVGGLGLTGLVAYDIFNPAPSSQQTPYVDTTPYGPNDLDAAFEEGFNTGEFFGTQRLSGDLGQEFQTGIPGLDELFGLGDGLPFFGGGDGFLERFASMPLGAKALVVGGPLYLLTRKGGKKK